MASKRAIMGAAAQEKIDSLVLPRKEDRPTIGPQTAHNETTEGPQEAHKRPTMEAIRLRLLAADLAALDALAAVEGSTRSGLIRRAVKELIRRGGK